MRKIALFLPMVFLALPLWAAEQTWKDVPMVDVMCAAKVKADPDVHARACALQCQKSGFGILTADGTFLKFDAAGNARAIEALKASRKTDHLRVTVTGEREGDTLKVRSLTL